VSAARKGARVQTPPGVVRIVGGRLKRSRLPVAEAPGLRPTPDRVRETLFNWLGADLAGWRCVDAFAGSGALGFEAASRGAAQVVLVERDRRLAASLAATARRLGADAVRVACDDAIAWMARADAGHWDLVLLDPPFDSGLSAPALSAALRLVAPGGFVYVEGPAMVEAPPGWRVHRASRAGAVHYALLAPDGSAYTAPAPADRRAP
jgi:16S rRNA (guanine(966)-N(2))-methyltransferase RsmD